MDLDRGYSPLASVDERCHEQTRYTIASSSSKPEIRLFNHLFTLLATFYLAESYAARES